MKHHRSIRGSLALALVGGLFAQLASADPLPNAWQVTHNTTASSSTLYYTNQLSLEQQVAATNGGFRFSVNARLVDDFDGSETMTMIYGLGNKRFLIWWDLDGNNDLTARLDGAITAYKLTTNGTGTALYHTHEIIYTNGTASYLFDGQMKTNNWPSSGNAWTNGAITWGAGSSSGKGQMNFNRVTFEITNHVVASYDAGTNGSPAAPNPATRGWTLVPSMLPDNTGVTNVSPDTALLPVAVTLAADQFMPEGARLNGQANPNGLPTTAWFEWGTGTNYGMTTAPQIMGSGLNPLNHNAVLGGLLGGPEYHYRLVASNAFGISVGTDQSFTIPSFLLITIPGLPQVADSSVAWGDHDGDGRLDFLLTGLSSTGRVSQLWRNTGSGFTNVPINGLRGVGGSASGASSECSLAWGDFDRDGRLDFLITGTTNGNASGAISQVWRNMSSGFTNVPIPNLPGVQDSAVAWGDFDNDGRLDFLLTGVSSNGEVSQLWRNTGSGFTNVPVPGLPGVGHSSVAWSDFDNDRRIDLLLTGTTNELISGALSRLWRNTGTGFTNVTGTIASGLAAVHNSSVAWGDYDNDGRLDFILTGFSSTGRRSQLWRNTGSGFANVPIPNLPGVGGSSVAWGDCDGDGRLDFLLTGTTDGTSDGSVGQLWRNTGSGFTNPPISGLPAVRDGSIAWGDYNNDGRLDLLITGLDSSGAPVSQLWRNNLPASNAPPAAPINLSATVSGTTVALDWMAPADDHTPAAGLSYNVRIGTTPGGSDVLAPMALTNGHRLLPALGNAQAATSALYDLKRLPPGQTCYWSVQAVDTSFAGSPFASERQFIVDPVTATIVTSPTIYGTPPWTIQFIGQAHGGLPQIDTTDDQSGTITAQGQNLPNEGAAKAFDNTNSTKWLDFATNNPSTRASWIQYQYRGEQTHTVTRYTITSANDASPRDPKDWKILGSNNGGTSWVVLDTRTNEMFTSRFLTRSFSFANTTAYNIYRFTNESVLNPLSANSVQLAELEFIGDYAYAWEFGDGATSNVQSPQHTYPSNGTYTVTLIVFDGVSTATNTLSVNAGDPQFNSRPRIQQPILLANGVFQFAFSNVGAATVEIRATTNLALPAIQWDLLGLPTPVGGSLYQFNDGLAPNHPQRFYLLREQ